MSASAATAWLYLRVSTKRQATKGGEPEGYSLPVQRQISTQKAATLDAVVIEEYVDRGETARKMDRPELQRLLRDLRDKEPPTYLIVYKIDRWARDSIDGMALVSELRQKKVQLVSAGEGIDDTPEGRLMLTILLGMAEYDSTGKAGRIRDNMRRAAEQGVTMGKAAVGYLNVRRYENGQELKSIEIDPDRAPHVRWAFDAYDTGEWTLQALTDELEERGLRTAPARQKLSKPLSKSNIGRMLRNPYYLGKVQFGGVWYPGKHEPLVTQALFDRVGLMLTAKNYAGEKERTHHHYLKGTIFCGQCGSRLCMTFNRGRGGIYDYFFCIGRQKKRTDCDQGHLRVELIENLIEHFYDQVSLTAPQIAELRQKVAGEIDAEVAGFRAEIAQQQKRLTRLQDERQKLLRAHYDDAIPLDMMKAEMKRIDGEAAEAEARVSACSEPYDKLVDHLGNLEHFISSVATVYRQGDGRTRRHVNQALWKKLLITIDGVVAAEPTSLLAGLVSLPRTVALPSGAGPEACERPRDGQGSTNPAPGVRGSRVVDVVRPLGLEPRTCGLRVRCSAN
jgi:site-specific DNA recombinase